MLDPTTFPKIIVDFNRSVPKSEKGNECKESSDDEEIELDDISESVAMMPPGSYTSTRPTGAGPGFISKALASKHYEHV